MLRVESPLLQGSPAATRVVRPHEGEEGHLRPLRVCFFRHSLFNRGGDRIILQYANHLAERGHQITLLVNEIATAFSIHHGVQVQRIPFPSKLGTLAYGLFGRFGADVVIVDLVALAYWLRPFHRVVYLAQAHDVLYYRNPILRRLTAWFYGQFFRAPCHPAIADSQFLASEFRVHYGAPDIPVVEIGVDLDRFFVEPDPRLVASKSGRKAILILARSDVYRKGGDIGQIVLRNVCRSGSDQLELWVIGSSQVRLPDGVRVTHFGKPTDHQLRRILSSADALFYPSRHEGFGLFPLEAMACGCPVVTTTAVPYVIDGENAYATSPDDTAGLEERLTEALVDELTTAAIRERARAFASRRNITTSQTAFEAALRGVVESSG